MIIVLRGYLDEDEVRDAVARIMNAADALTPGFTIINNISQFAPASPVVISEIEKVQSYVHGKGVGKIIRIVENILSRHQLEKAQQKIGAGYEVVEVESMEEAMRHVWKNELTGRISHAPCQPCLSGSPRSDGYFSQALTLSGFSFTHF